FLFAEIPDADRQDRPVRRGFVAEPPDVRLAERPFPGERLPTDGPGTVAAACALGDLGQPRGHAGSVVQSRHMSYRNAAAALVRPGWSGACPMIPVTG